MTTDKALQEEADRAFDAFRAEVEYWRVKLGLIGWGIVVNRGATGHNTHAKCVWDAVARLATITLNSDYDDTLTEDDYRKTAFHECCHVLLGKLHNMATEYVAEYLTSSECHAIIMTLENTLWADDWRSRQEKRRGKP